MPLLKVVWRGWGAIPRGPTERAWAARAHVQTSQRDLRVGLCRAKPSLAMRMSWRELASSCSPRRTTEVCGWAQLVVRSAREAAENRIACQAWIRVTASPVNKRPGAQTAASSRVVRR